MPNIRQLAIILGDQLDRQPPLFDDFDKSADRLWMAEVEGESTHVWTHKARIAVFLAAMRHFRDELAKKDYSIDYRQLGEGSSKNGDGETLAKQLTAAIKRHKPERLTVVQPGEWRVLNDLQQVADKHDLPLDVLEDTHFFSTPAEFAEHAKGRKQLRQEFFYRELRRKTGVLMDDGDPVGGSWNYDSENRGSFGKKGPQDLPAPHQFRSDKITKQVLEEVEERFAKHPGKLDQFDWPVTPKQAKVALDDFIKDRLPNFGDYQDAMWTDEPWLYHSRISAAMNLKLLNPRDVVKAAEKAYQAGDVPLNAAEGFIRQILGWREYVRGIYWLYMPGYLDRNTMNAKEPLPEFFWTGETDMHCLSQAIGQTLDYGYAHHIQRLMVTGLFCLLLGVDPKAVHEWYLAVYVDAVEWVELPNSLGMSQYADGGIMASKPYVATGKYIQRMSNYCGDCQFNPANATGDDACPFTTLYWDYLMRHQDKLKGNNRMSLQLKNIERKSEEEREEIREKAKQVASIARSNS